jgi:hypothetical protein
MKGFSLASLSGACRGFMPSQLKTKKQDLLKRLPICFFFIFLQKRLFKAFLLKGFTNTL